MSTFEKFLDNRGWLFTGLIGALVAVPFHEDKTIKGRLWFVCSGATCAYFLTGFWAWAYEIPEGLTGAIGFMVGAFGGSFVATVIKKLQNADLGALIDILKDKFKGKP